MILEPAKYYTPAGMISVCVGFNPVSRSLDAETRFRVSAGEKLFISSITGSEGLQELKGMLEADGYKLPADFGDVRPMAIPNIKISDRSVIANLPKALEIPQTRLTFQYRNSYGSFNRAVKNALTAIQLHRSFRILACKQQEQFIKSVTA